MADTPTVSVSRNAARHRFELQVDGQPAGELVYRERDGALDLLHTEVDDAYQGRGLAAQLVRSALDEARASGQKVIPSCAYVKAFLERHPGDRDLVAA